MSEIRFWRGVVSILAVALVLVFLFSVWDVLLPFIFGLVIAYLFHPLVDRFVAMGLRRDRVVAVLYVLLLIGGIGLGSWMLPRLYREANLALSSLPSYASVLNEIIDNSNLKIQQALSRFLGGNAANIVVPFRAEDLVQTLFSSIPGSLLNFAHFGLWVFIIPIVSFFALGQGKRWINHLFQLTPSQYVESLLGLMAEINATLGGYVRGLFLESAFVGFLTMAGLLAMDIKGAILLGFVTGVLNVVPFLALIIGGVVAIIAGYVQTQSWAVVLMILTLFLVVRLVDDIFIIPFVIGSQVSLHPIVTLFAILAGVELGGFVGLVFAIPAAAVVKVVLTIILRNRSENFLPSSGHVYS